MKWADLYTSRGVYVSPEYDISSNYRGYNEAINFYYNKNDGEVKVYISVSFDSGNTWGQWIQVNDAAYDKPFFDDYYDLEYCKFKYMVEMTYSNGVSPQFNEFSMSLIGAYDFFNNGDLPCKPEIWIKKTNGSGDVKLFNDMTGQIVEFKNLNNNEEVYVDCENEDIVSSLPLVYRYDDHNNEFLELDIGENYLSGDGEFELVIRHEFKTLQG